jgi:hypothetical protein
MRVLTVCELMSFTRPKLESLLNQISAILPTLAERSLDRCIALINLKNIKRELIRREMASGPWRR